MDRAVMVNILRVFVDSTGNFGNFASIIIDEGRKIDPSLRQKITRQLSHDESVFINDLVSGDVSIYNPQREVRFAGHAMVGTAWFLNKLQGETVAQIHCLGGELKVWHDGALTWVRAGLNMMPPWHHIQLENAKAIERVSSTEAAKMEHTMVWTWIDENKGTIRARTFASDWGIPESEANGSGSMMLAVMLRRKLEIIHGEGSVIFTKQVGKQQAAIGGRVAQEPVQKIAQD